MACCILKCRTQTRSRSIGRILSTPPERTRRAALLCRGPARQGVEGRAVGRVRHGIGGAEPTPEGQGGVRGVPARRRLGQVPGGRDVVQGCHPTEAAKAWSFKKASWRSTVGRRFGSTKRRTPGGGLKLRGSMRRPRPVGSSLILPSRFSCNSTTITISDGTGRNPCGSGAVSRSPSH